MKYIIGKKIGMTQVFTEDGRMTPVTVIEAEPNVVVQVKTQEKDGYQAVQLGSGSKKRISKSLAGHFKGLGNFRYVREFRGSVIDEKELNVGDKIDVSMFKVGDVVKASATTKGKGFQGAVKRHGFHGMPASHGHRAVQRHVGSIGQRFPQHTLKGTRMAGRMGADRVTMRGLKVMTVDIENNIIAVRGALPGNNGTLVEVSTLK